MKTLYLLLLIFITVSCHNHKSKQLNASQNDSLNYNNNFSEEHTQYRDITGLVDADVFYQLITTCDSALIFDIRPREVYKSEPRIKGGKLIYDFTYFKEALKDIHRNHQIMVYCGMELRSPAAVKALVNQGFNNVYELQGGLAVWKKLKLPMVDAQGNEFKYPAEE